MYLCPKIFSMNRLSLLYLLYFSSSLTAQVWEDELLKTNPNPTIEEKSQAFEEYRATHPYTKGNGYKPYAREMDFILERNLKIVNFKQMLYIKNGKKRKDSDSKQVLQMLIG